MSKWATIVVVGIALHTIAVCDLFAQCELQKLARSSGLPREYAGFSADASAGRFVVGAPNNTAGGALKGIAYVYAFDGTEWFLENSLRPIQTGPLQLFGTSVSISNDWALVGAPNGVSPANLLVAGSVYAYRFDGANWVGEATIIPVGGRPYEMFGWSVDVSGTLAVVGAPEGRHCVSF